MATSLIVEVGANVARMQRDMNRISRHVETTTQKMTRLFKGVGVALGAAFTVRAITNFMKATIDLADETAKMSQRLGIAVERLSEYRYMAELSGTSFEGVAKAVQQLSKNMLIATQGTNETTRAFRMLGIQIKDAHGRLRDNNEVMGDVADKFARMKDGTEKTALAMTIFGRAGTAIIPMLNKGREGLEQMRGEAQRLGTVISKDFARDSEQFNDNMARLKSLASAAAITIGGPLVRAVNRFLETLLRWRGIELEKTEGQLEKQIRLITERLSLMREQSRIGPRSESIDLIVAEKERSLILERLNLMQQLNEMREKAARVAPAVPAPAEADQVIPGAKETPKVLGNINLELEKLKMNLIKAQQTGTPVIEDQIDKLKELLGGWIKNREQIELVGKETLKLKDVVYKGVVQPFSDANIVIAGFADGMGNWVVNLPEIKEKTDELKSSTSELGYVFQSAAEDAIVNFENLRGVLQGLEKDIMRILARKWISKPLDKWITGTVVPWLSSLFHAGRGPGEAPQQYAVAPAAIFAGAPRFHGGREIPAIIRDDESVLTPAQMRAVGRRNTGVSINQNITIDARGADASVLPRIYRAMERMKQETKAEILNNRKRGGEFAKVYGA